MWDLFDYFHCLLSSSDSKLGSSYNVLYFDDFLLTEAQIVVHSRLILKPEESCSCLDEIESRNCCNLTAI